MFPAISWNAKVVISVITGIATIVFGVFSVVLQSNLVYAFKRLIPSWRKAGGRKPTSKPRIVWNIYYFSIVVMILGTAVVNAWKEAPIPAPPLSEKLNFVTVVDASDRMLSSINNGEQKWQVAVRSLQDKLSVLPSGANFGLIDFGQVSSANPLPCSDTAELLVPVNDPSNADGSSQQRTLSAIDGIIPGNKGSLNSALKLALEQLAALPQDYSKTLIIVTGGGDSCDLHTEWDILEFVLGGTIEDVNVYTELIVLVNEEVKAEIEMKVQKISRLEAVQVSLPTSAEELDEDLENAVNRAIERGKVVDPAPFIVQETIVAATQISQSSNDSSTLLSTNPTNTPPVVVLAPSRTQASKVTQITVPSLTPTVISTATVPVNTATFLPTLTPVYIPPTSTPKSISPTNTSTNIPPTPVPTSLPEVLYISDPGNGTSLNCPISEDCIIPVTIQWISDTQAVGQGLNLSVWVKPYPGNSNYLFYSQTPVNYLGNGQWKSPTVYIGSKGIDEMGTPFAIYVIVTNQFYDTGVKTTPLPVHTKEASIEVTR